MEFNEKLQELRRQKGLTQEELAEALWVSRTAVSKWESGRGYPSIDSLKQISKYFSVSIDALLSGEELLTIAEEEGRVQKSRFQDLIFGLLDVSVALFLMIPLVLGSWYALIPFGAYPAIIIVRLKDEEELLTKELPGYAEYKQKVKYRIIPFTW